jgi:trans-2,3-dihydro-3-hydroxyanthranilate isomerase
MKKDCVFIDVFTDTPYAGNQLAVFPNADDLTSDQMQLLANEINYSETTFILDNNDVDADYQIRIFTPKQEMPFAGHPTLGTAFSIVNVYNMPRNNANVLRLKTNVGVIPLEIKSDVIWMRQNKPEFFRQYTNKNEIADLVCMHPEDISDLLPVEEVSTGNKILIVPVTSLAAIKKAQGNANKLDAFFKLTGCLAPYVFTTETVDLKADVHTRFFAPHAGILEDPATGSAAGPLTAYLLKHNVFGNKFELVNEQGIEINRPSKIFMNGSFENNEYEVNIGGTCILIGKAEFTL